MNFYKLEQNNKIRIINNFEWDMHGVLIAVHYGTKST